MRNVILQYEGGFSFADETQNLFCNICKLELPFRSVDTIHQDVNSHVNQESHVNLLANYLKTESSSLNASLANAIIEGIFLQILEGIVRCSLCSITMSDSLSVLKKHLLSDQHKFSILGLPLYVKQNVPNANSTISQNGQQNGHHPASRKLVLLVGGNRYLEFVPSSETDGKFKVRCTKCNRQFACDHNDVYRHLQSKMHRDEKRKPYRKTKKSQHEDETLPTSSTENCENAASTKPQISTTKRKCKVSTTNIQQQQQHSDLQEVFVTTVDHHPQQPTSSENVPTLATRQILTTELPTVLPSSFQEQQQQQPIGAPPMYHHLQAPIEFQIVTSQEPSEGDHEQIDHAFELKIDPTNGVVSESANWSSTAQFFASLDDFEGVFKET